MECDDNDVMLGQAYIHLASLNEKKEKTKCIFTIAIPPHYECLQWFGHLDH